MGQGFVSLILDSICQGKPCIIRPNKEKGVFQVTGLKNLGRVGRHIYKCIFISHFFFLEKNNFMRFERHFAFQNEKKKCLKESKYFNFMMMK